jgi:xanthine dehydrogenase accessory factor
MSSEKVSHPSMGDMADRIYNEILRLRSQGKIAALATIIRVKGSSPGKNLFKMLVYPDGKILGTIGGGITESHVVSEALNVIKTRESKILEFKLSGHYGSDLPICGGEFEVFIEPIVPTRSLYIMGAGHIAQPLAEIGKMLGFRVVVWDDNEEYGNRERFPRVDEVYVCSVDKLAEHVKVDPLSYVVIVTRGHKSDREVLKTLIDEETAYIGMIGSLRKIKEVFCSLMDEGVEKEQLDRVYAPVGFDIGAQTPSEIAVSIIAEIIAHVYGKAVKKSTLQRLNLS